MRTCDICTVLRNVCHCFPHNSCLFWSLKQVDTQLSAQREAFLREVDMIEGHMTEDLQEQIHVIDGLDANMEDLSYEQSILTSAVEKMQQVLF